MVAWNVSGGHFNPAITIGLFIANKNFRANAAIAFVMMAGQFAGAMLGLLFGYFALISKDYMEVYAADGGAQHSRTPVPHDTNVDSALISILYPQIPVISGNDKIYEVKWQLFWAMFVSGMILSLAFTSIKGRSTQMTDNHAFQAISVFIVMIGISSMNARYFGSIGYNPAIACA